MIASSRAVGRRRREELVRVAIAADRHRRAAVSRHAIDVVHAARQVVAVRKEVQPLAIARPPVELIQPVVVGHALDVAGGEREDVDVAAAGPRRDERELRLVGREDRMGIVGRVRDRGAWLPRPPPARSRCRRPTRTRSRCRRARCPARRTRGWQGLPDQPGRLGRTANNAATPAAAQS